MSTDDPSKESRPDGPDEEFEQRLQALREFDLSPVTERLRYKEDRDDAEDLEMKFRRYAKLLLERPDADVAISEDLDEYWHAFILDTPRYHRFCEQVFGEYLHHVPGDPVDRDPEAYVERVENDEVDATDAHCHARVGSED